MLYIPVLPEIVLEDIVTTGAAVDSGILSDVVTSVVPVHCCETRSWKSK